MKQDAIKVCGRQFRLKDIAFIQKLIDDDKLLTRAALSRKVCQLLDWRAADGRLKDMSCRVALLKLQRKGLLSLPKATKTIVRNARKGPPPLKHKKPILTPAGQLKALSLVPVTSAVPKLSKLWNAIIAHYHYLGYKPLVGAQLRYLIHCADGWLGALGFSAAAWKVAPRDQFIGWSPQQREANLQYIACNSRFLILPWVKSKNLASKVLSLAAKHIAFDWLKAYGFQPVLLETFVDKERFLGTCYRAANWHHVGQTQGRGKLDRNHAHALSVKNIYLYPLCPNFRDILCRTGGL